MKFYISLLLKILINVENIDLLVRYIFFNLVLGHFHSIFLVNIKIYLECDFVVRNLEG